MDDWQFWMIFCFGVLGFLWISATLNEIQVRLSVIETIFTMMGVSHKDKK